MRRLITTACILLLFCACSESPTAPLEQEVIPGYPAHLIGFWRTNDLPHYRSPTEVEHYYELWGFSVEGWYVDCVISWDDTRLYAKGEGRYEWIRAERVTDARGREYVEHLFRLIPAELSEPSPGGQDKLHVRIVFESRNELLIGGVSENSAGNWLWREDTERCKALIERLTRESATETTSP